MDDQEKIALPTAMELPPSASDAFAQPSGFDFWQARPHAMQYPQPTMILHQPMEIPPEPEEEEVPDSHTFIAWFTCLCCCIPLGLYAIFKSREVEKAVNRGDLLTAKKASTASMISSVVGICLGTCIAVAFLFIVVMHFDKFVHTNYS